MSPYVNGFECFLFFSSLILLFFIFLFPSIFTFYLSFLFGKSLWSIYLSSGFIWWVTDFFGFGSILHLHASKASYYWSCSKDPIPQEFYTFSDTF